MSSLCTATADRQCANCQLDCPPGYIMISPCTVTANMACAVIPSPSITPSPCPALCAACVATSCSACVGSGFASLFPDGTTNDYRCRDLISALPATILCTITESATVHSTVSCVPPLPAALPLPAHAAFALSPVTTTGAVHPFIITTAALITLGPTPRLDFNTQQQYNITLSLCFPQLLAAFTAWGAPLSDFTSCAASTARLTASVSVTINILEANKPPVFLQPLITFSFRIASPVNASVGVPLLQFCTDPNTKAPWNAVSFSLGGQRDDVTFSINPITGQLLYVMPATRFINSTTFTVIASDGGGLAASANVTIIFSTTTVQLTVIPNSVSVVHYSPGVSTSTIAVDFSAGSAFGATWSVRLATPVPWLSVVVLTPSYFQLLINTTAYGDSDVSTVGSSLSSVVVFTVLSGDEDLLCG